MRTRIFDIIEIAGDGDRASLIYDRTMMVLIFASMVPLFFKQSNTLFQVTDRLTAAGFILDYLLRWGTADKKLDKGGLLAGRGVCAAVGADYV